MLIIQGKDSGKELPNAPYHFQMFDKSLDDQIAIPILCQVVPNKFSREVLPELLYNSK